MSTEIIKVRLCNTPTDAASRYSIPIPHMHQSRLRENISTLNADLGDVATTIAIKASFCFYPFHIRWQTHFENYCRHGEKKNGGLQLIESDTQCDLCCSSLELRNKSKDDMSSGKMSRTISKKFFA